MTGVSFEICQFLSLIPRFFVFRTDSPSNFSTVSSLRAALSAAGWAFWRALIGPTAEEEEAARLEAIRRQEREFHEFVRQQIVSSNRGSLSVLFLFVYFSVFGRFRFFCFVFVCIVMGLIDFPSPPQAVI